MVKPYVAMASLVGGISFAGLAVWIETEPGALTSPEPIEMAAPEVKVIGAAAALNVEQNLSLPEEKGVITLEPVLITAPRKVAPLGAPTLQVTPEPAPVPQMATEPCSDWRELGPKATETTPGATHKVRQLCVS